MQWKQRLQLFWQALLIENIQTTWSTSKPLQECLSSSRLRWQLRESQLGNPCGEAELAVNLITEPQDTLPEPHKSGICRFGNRQQPCSRLYCSFPEAGSPWLEAVAVHITFLLFITHVHVGIDNLALKAVLLVLCIWTVYENIFEDA